ncbi:hypothetical protein D3C80_1197180 [compost metagenome]
MTEIDAGASLICWEKPDAVTTMLSSSSGWVWAVAFAVYSEQRVSARQDLLKVGDTRTSP